MEVLRRLLDTGDTYGAMAMLQAIQQIDMPVLEAAPTQEQMNDATAEAMSQYQEGAGQYVGNISTNLSQGINPGPATPQPTPQLNLPPIQFGSNRESNYWSKL